MSSDPRECREQARECARIAMSSSDPRDGADYAALAYTWLKLAEIFEHDNAMLARWDKDSKVVPLSSKAACVDQIRSSRVGRRKPGSR